MWKLDAAMAPSRAFIETIRGWLIDLDHLEATGAATPDTCEVLVELHELLDKLYRTMENRARKNMQFATCPHPSKALRCRRVQSSTQSMGRP